MTGGKLPLALNSTAVPTASPTARPNNELLAAMGMMKSMQSRATVL